jgi:hypothetical protein
MLCTVFFRWLLWLEIERWIERLSWLSFPLIWRAQLGGMELLTRYGLAMSLLYPAAMAGGRQRPVVYIQSFGKWKTYIKQILDVEFMSRLGFAGFNSTLFFAANQICFECVSLVQEKKRKFKPFSLIFASSARFSRQGNKRTRFFNFLVLLKIYNWPYLRGPENSF